ncbi:MAG: isoamylase early set domain-containing protein [Chloroflexi bacterium]|nr:isoamylase early set domain-containing protein [Chloroflexota bacterium]
MPKKDYSQTGGPCQVTFEIPSEVNAQTACLCGEFNNWSEAAHVMARRDDGSFALAIPLQPGRAYQFRYLLDGGRWENDWAADEYVPNPFGSDNSVVRV